MATTDPFAFADEFGPGKVVHIWQPNSGLKAIVVIDNVAAGPSIGGIRMARDVSAEECFRLARAMTFKNITAGLAHGGGKSVIFADPRQPAADKQRLIRAFARAIRHLNDYIPGPDMGTDETCMAWLQDEIGRAVGLPAEIGGIPLDQIGATGLGVAVASAVAADHIGLALAGARVAIQGFGAVGMHAARFLTQRGAVLVAASDSKGSIHDDRGLEVAALIALKREGRSVVEHGAGRKGDLDAVIDIACDIWVPAARPDVLTRDNVGRLNARMVVEGANIPVSEAAEADLHAKDVLVVPDFVANAGGVICAAVEYHGGSQSQALQAIADKIETNCRAVLGLAKKDRIMPRQAAQALATARLRRAMALRLAT